MKAPRALLASALIAAVVSAGACAKERGEGGASNPRRFLRVPRNPQQQQQQPTASAPTATTTTTSTAPSATASTTATTPAPTGTVPPPITQTELIKFQDACWKNCDQVACMKIAEAYRTGSGLPQDVLAGRRYAVHACQECGTPSIAVESFCPAWGLDKK
jgi:hypothetical protein